MQETKMQFPEIARDDVFILGSQRLWLRWPRASDARDFAAFAGRREVADMTATWPYPLPVGEVERRIALARSQNLAGEAMIFAMTPWHTPGLVIGLIGAHFRDGSDRFVVGYMLHPKYWGCGLMSEALGVVLGTAFRLTKAKAALAGVRPGNPRSRRVLEKHGFVLEGQSCIDAPARGTKEVVDDFRLERRVWRTGLTAMRDEVVKNSTKSCYSMVEHL
jgi:RimJ/RimL family protein N-acetyltransferase